MNDDRWFIAIHEAGHAVAGIALGGQVDGVVLMFDGGLAHVRGLHCDRHAFMVASGPAAEYLSQQHAAPERVAETPPPLPANADFQFAEICYFADRPGLLKTFESDDRKIAQWAIDGRESEPESWAGRVQFCHHIAAKIVAENEACIVEIARQLFIHGRLTSDEVSRIYQEQKA